MGAEAKGIHGEPVTSSKAPVASWFETRGVAALLTMRDPDLILRSRASGVSKDEAPELVA